jgi:hypothetical protein
LRAALNANGSNFIPSFHSIISFKMNIKKQTKKEIKKKGKEIKNK